MSEPYRRAVADTIAAQRAASGWAPDRPRSLRLITVEQPRSLDELAPDVRRCLLALFKTEAQLAAVLGDHERAVEVARVADDDDLTVGLIAAWNYGVSYAFDTRDRLVAYGSQHDVEAWHLGQRPLFFELDRALRDGPAVLRQPIAYRWWDDGLWSELADDEDRGDPMLAALR